MLLFLGDVCNEKKQNIFFCHYKNAQLDHKLTARVNCLVFCICCTWLQSGEVFGLERGIKPIQQNHVIQF